MKALQQLKKLGEGAMIAFSFIVLFAIIFLAGGGMAIFASPDTCSGEQEIRVGEATTYWEIAEREFPNDDPRVVSTKMVEMNNGDYDPQHRKTIKGPVDC